MDVTIKGSMSFGIRMNFMVIQSQGRCHPHDVTMMMISGIVCHEYATKIHSKTISPCFWLFFHVVSFWMTDLLRGLPEPSSSFAVTGLDLTKPSGARPRRQALGKGTRNWPLRSQDCSDSRTSWVSSPSSLHPLFILQNAQNFGRTCQQKSSRRLQSCGDTLFCLPD